ncbi:MAG TPA: hypothetical protein ENK82_05925 [Campylobacterales bacterium]|nr:hypothetical protein [Campylobacterales bacterium]HHS92867.1 hypothetical protein [Campylobacterales bacterium]
MFFITGMSTFTWILLAYVILHVGADHISYMKDLSLHTVVLTHHISPERDFVLRIREVFLILGSLALFIEIAKAATASKFGATETLLSFIVAMIFIVMFFMVSWAQNATFLILGMMSLIDATGGFIIELNAARRDINVNGGGILG